MSNCKCKHFIFLSPSRKIQYKRKNHFTKLIETMINPKFESSHPTSCETKNVITALLFYLTLFRHEPWKWLLITRRQGTVCALKLGRSSTKYCNLPVAPRAKRFFLSKAMCFAVILGKFHQPKTKTFHLALYTSKVNKSLSASLIQDASGC